MDDDVCVCGHNEDLHHRWQDDPVNCFGLIGGHGDLPCGCREFRTPAPPPARDDAETVIAGLLASWEADAEKYAAMGKGRSRSHAQCRQIAHTLSECANELRAALGDA